MKPAPLALALACLAEPSLALSCLAPDVTRTFNDAAASEKSYIVIHGTLTFDEAKLPEFDVTRQDQVPPYVDIDALFSGKALSGAGFDIQFDRAVTLRSLCYGPWCGQAVSGGEHLAFLEQTDAGYVLALSPCGEYDFPDPSNEMLDLVAQCFRDGACAP